MAQWPFSSARFYLAALRSRFKHAGLPAQQHAWEKKKSKQILQRGGEHFELTLGDTQRTANRGEPARREKRKQRQARRGSVPKIRASTRGARSVLDMGAAACSAQTGGNGGVTGFISEPTWSRDVNGDKTWLRETRVLQRFQIF